jgi:two-component system, NarL family, sensor kinase
MSRFLLIIFAVLLHLKSFSTERTTSPEKLKIDTALINSLNKKARELYRTDIEQTKSNSEKAIGYSRIIKYKKGEGEGFANKGLYFLVTGKNDSSLYYLKNAVQIGKTIKEHPLAADGLNIMGLLYYNIGDVSPALECFLESLKFKRLTGNKKEIAKALNNIGGMYSYRMDLDKALNYYLESLKIDEELNDTAAIGGDYLNIGDLYRSKKDYRNAELYLRKAISITPEANFIRLGDIHLNLGTVYENQDKPDEGRDFYKKALNYFSKANNLRGIAKSYNNLGIIEESIGNLKGDKQQYVLAAKYYKKAFDINKELENQIGMEKALSNLGSVQIQQGLLQEGVNTILESVKMAKANNTNESLLNTYPKLIETYAKMSNYTKAYEYSKLYSELKDSAYTLESTKQMAEMQTKYETEKKENENKLLIKENKIKALEISRQANQRNIMLGSFAFLMLLGGISYNRYRLKQKNKILLERELRTQAVFQAQEQEKIRISKDLHDGVGPLLSLIKMNISSLDINPGNEKIITKTKELASESIKEVRNISHSLMPGLLLKSGLQSALIELIEQFNNKDLEVELDYQVSSPLKPEAEVNIYRINQESINNILKHSGANKAKIKLEQKNQHLFLTITDNGKGFDENNQSLLSGNGLNNIYSRVDFMKGKINISSKLNSGTSFYIQLPLNHITNA